MNPSKPMRPKMDDAAIGTISNLGLAHMGDAVYEMLVRTWLCTHGRVTAKGLQGGVAGGLRQKCGALGNEARSTQLENVFCDVRGNADVFFLQGDKRDCRLRL